MRRERSTPRPDWRQKIEEQGLVFGTPAMGQNGARPYWDESVHYVFDMAEILSLEADVELMHSMCLEAVDHVVTTERFRDFALPEWCWEQVAASWKRHDPHLYGRFDLRYDGSGSREAAGVQRRHPDDAARGEHLPVVLAQGRLRRLPGPVELAAREAGRAVGGDRR